MGAVGEEHLLPSEGRYAVVVWNKAICAAKDV